MTRVDPLAQDLINNIVNNASSLDTALLPETLSLKASLLEALATVLHGCGERITPAGMAKIRDFLETDGSYTMTNSVDAVLVPLLVGACDSFGKCISGYCRACPDATGAEDMLSSILGPVEGLSTQSLFSESASLVMKRVLAAGYGIQGKTWKLMMEPGVEAAGATSWDAFKQSMCYGFIQRIAEVPVDPTSHYEMIRNTAYMYVSFSTISKV